MFLRLTHRRSVIEELLSLNPNNLHLVIFIIIFNFHTNKKDTAWQSGRVTAVEAQVYPSFLFPLCDLFEKATVIQCEKKLQSVIFECRPRLSF